MNEDTRRRGRTRQRGVTLVEVLIVVAIMAVIAGMATIAAFPELKKARIRTAAMGAGAVQEAAKIYRDVDMVWDGTACPTVTALVDAKKLDAKRVNDPWGTPYGVTCDEEDIHGVSAGNDRRPGTPDDVRDDVKPADVERIAGM
jgi:general secretion pathway protein G